MARFIQPLVAKLPLPDRPAAGKRPAALSVRRLQRAVEADPADKILVERAVFHPFRRDPRCLCRLLMRRIGTHEDGLAALAAGLGGQGVRHRYRSTLSSLPFRRSSSRIARIRQSHSRTKNLSPLVLIQMAKAPRILGSQLRTISYASSMVIASLPSLSPRPSPPPRPEW